MSPQETQDAALIKNLSTQDFITTYASHTLSDGKQSWIQIKNNSEGDACVFLENNQCSIYEARPVQCSTYPFWPNILKSEKAWNEEVRLADDKEGGPYWNQVDGGCEGMQYTNQIDEQEVETGVSIPEAQAKLEDYEWDERRFPSHLADIQKVED